MHKQLKFLLVVAFVEGASVMAVELSGAKLIAPYFGTSLYVWASVIGVTMMGLALGYFLGGRMSEKVQGPGRLFAVVAAAAFFTGLMPLDSRWIMEATLSLDVRWGSLISAMVFLLPPMFLFGMVSPLIIRLGALQPEKAGKVSGMVFALSTVGGILTTFLMGFYLIPAWGLRKPLWLFAGLLFVLPLLFWSNRRQWKRALVVLVLAVSMPLLNWVFAHKLGKDPSVIIQKEIEGMNGNLLVVDEEIQGDSIRSLYLNGRPQTLQRLDSDCPGHNYVVKMANLAGLFPEGARVLQFGLGGGTLLGELQQLDLEVDVVELDPRMEEVAGDWFGVDVRRSRVLNDDARHFVNTMEGEYDCILVDVFFGDNPPGHVITVESLKKMHAHLKPEGLLGIYFPGPLQGEGSAPARGLVKTLRKAGFSVVVLSTPTQGFGGRTFIGSKERFSYQTYPKRRGSRCSRVLQLSSIQPIVKQFRLEQATVFTDDNPLLENMFRGRVPNRRHFY